MKKIFLKTLPILILMLTFSCSSDAQNNEKVVSVNDKNTQIELIQFHNEHRCRTCLAIEDNAIKVAQKFSNISFKLVNVDDKENHELVMDFKAFGSSLFLYNPESGIKKDLTDFAFMNAMNEEKFDKGLSKEITQFNK